MSFSHQLDPQLDSSTLSSHSSLAQSPFLSKNRGFHSPSFADSTTFPIKTQVQSKRSIQLPFLRPSQHSSHFLLGINPNKFDYPEPVSSTLTEKVPETIASPFPLNHLSFKGEGHKRRIGFYTPDLYHQNQQLEDRIGSSSEIDAQEEPEEETPTPRIPMTRADIELIISQIKDLSSIAKKTRQKKPEKSRHNSLEVQGNSLQQMVELPLEFLNKNDTNRKRHQNLNDSSESINSFIDKRFPLKLAYRRRSCHCTWCGDLPPKQRDIENNPWVTLLAEWEKFTKPKEVPKIEVKDDYAYESMSSKRGSRRVSGFMSPGNLKRPSLYKGRTSGRLISGNSSPMMPKSSNGLTPTLKESKIEIIEEDEPVVKISTRRTIKRFQTEVFARPVVNSPMSNKNTVSSLQITKVTSLDIKPLQNNHHGGGKSFTCLVGNTPNKPSEFGKLNAFLNDSEMRIETENNPRSGSILNLKRKTMTPTNMFYRPENKRTSMGKSIEMGQSKTIISKGNLNLTRPSFVQENSQQSRKMNKTVEFEGGAGKAKKSIKLVKLVEANSANLPPEKKALKRILGKIPMKMNKKEREESVEKRKVEQKQKEKEKKEAIEQIEIQKHSEFFDGGIQREKIVKAYMTQAKTGRNTPKLKILPRLMTETGAGGQSTQMYTEEDVIRVTSPTSDHKFLLEESKLKELRERYKTTNNFRSPSRGNVSVSNVVLIHKNLVEGGSRDKGKSKGS